MLSMLSLLPLVGAAEPPDVPQPIGVDTPPAVVPKAAGKVELDLDGAPFLEPDEPTPQARAEEAEAAPEPVDLKAAPKRSKKKLLIIIGAVLLLGVGAALYFLVFSAPSEEKKPDGQTVVVVQGPDWGQTAVSEHTIDFESFWVEVMDPEGSIRFLVCKFVIPTNSQANVLEMNAKMPIIRDAIYYYLKNKDYEFLSDNRNQAVIKKDIVDIIGGYLMSEKIEEVLLDTYIIK